MAKAQGLVVRDYHHRIALLIALGKQTSDIVREVGLSAQTVRSLRQNAEFQELVSRYKTKADFIEYQAFEQVNALMATIDREALLILFDRLVNEPEKITDRALLEIHADMSDRLGRSKVSRTESTSINVDLADSLAEARRREMTLSASEVSPNPDAEGGRVSSNQPEGPSPS